MRVERLSADKRTRNTSDVFIGAVDSQTVVGDEARDLRLAEHTFRDGARNKLHAHTTDQILIVTAGDGIIATEHEEREIGVGDVVHIPAGERHWHGAKAGHDMTHLAVLGAGKTFIVADDRPAD